jgi:hypothetical protein
MNEEALARVKLIEDNYLYLVKYQILDKNKKIYLRDRKPKTCRFCNNSYPVVTFNKTAHTIPRFTGNNALISYYECDTCNGIFSKMETQMTNFMHLDHTLFFVEGRSGVPKYKNTNETEIVCANNHIEITNVDPSKIIESKEENGFYYKDIVPTYIPALVYKCLTKMALSIIPEDSLIYFKDTLKWLIGNDQQVAGYNIPKLKALFTAIVSTHKLPGITCYVFQRNEQAEKSLPFSIFFLAYANFVFQIHIPFCSVDNDGLEKNINPVYIPSIDLQFGVDILEQKEYDLSSYVPLKGEEKVYFIQNLE